MDNDDTETYILLLLADSNLPTGSFVASSGLESYMKHGFASSAPSIDVAIVDFVRDSLASYARSSLPFVSDAHRAVMDYALCKGATDNVVPHAHSTLSTLAKLDELYQTMVLNHVARRASMTQGVAMLTLYSKGFSQSASLSVFSTPEARDHEARMRELIDHLKLKIRREETYGHLPICWGALTAALRISIERSRYLHLFLHARSLLSASVRLNELGPYGAQQVLLHAVRPLVEAEVARCQNLRTGFLDSLECFDDVTLGPANTWPLGEILAGRHDLQHSRIFNS
ncbi:urease accessory protein UreF [Gymnopilus junonius]|uniref:Urease accessory protein UreF n=1 Tax=Gymnopilus junonius TaxID=109634 RepID=A0A9P5P1Y7_GYMJU|nr:urease accessory protein UreF [Gymnopilus junonius]